LQIVKSEARKRELLDLREVYSIRLAGISDWSRGKLKPEGRRLVGVEQAIERARVHDQSHLGSVDLGNGLGRALIHHDRKLGKFCELALAGGSQRRRAGGREHQPNPPRRPARVGHATTETAIPEGEFRHEGPTSLFIFSFSQFA